jgi:hypothetical protein
VIKAHHNTFLKFSCFLKNCGNLIFIGREKGNFKDIKKLKEKVFSTWISFVANVQVGRNLTIDKDKYECSNSDESANFTE